MPLSVPLSLLPPSSPLPGSLSLFPLLLTMFFLLQSMDPLSHLTVLYHLETILQGKGLLAPNYIFIMTVKKGHNLLLPFFRVLIY